MAKKRNFIDSAILVAASVFTLKAALQGLIGWIAARLFAKWWKGKHESDPGVPSKESTKET